ncbi:hypothetical protein DFH09DRAFT_1084363 [Mycena vulgaris]|nr:hypothetical protein DFH09DRAFT_1084363 [Mycena vulgaris]
MTTVLVEKARAPARASGVQRGIVAARWRRIRTCTSYMLCNRLGSTRLFDSGTPRYSSARPPHFVLRPPPPRPPRSTTHAPPQSARNRPHPPPLRTKRTMHPSPSPPDSTCRLLAAPCGRRVPAYAYARNRLAAHEGRAIASRMDPRKIERGTQASSLHTPPPPEHLRARAAIGK